MSVEPRYEHKDMSIDIGGMKEMNPVAMAVELKLHEARQELRLANNLQSCCGSVIDKRLLIFIVNGGLSVVLVTFSIYGIISAPSCEMINLYSGILSYILGFWTSMVF